MEAYEDKLQKLRYLSLSSGTMKSYFQAIVSKIGTVCGGGWGLSPIEQITLAFHTPAT